MLKHDQIINLLSTKFNLPVELNIKILSNLSIPYLHKNLGANSDQLFDYLRKTGYEKFKRQLSEIGGYEIIDGRIKKLYKNVNLFNFRMTIILV